jgi:hypothetical protein
MPCVLLTQRWVVDVTQEDGLARLAAMLEEGYGSAVVVVMRLLRRLSAPPLHQRTAEWADPAS